MTRGWGGGDDPERTASPELHQHLRAKRGGGGSAYVQTNRGKRSLLVDVQKPAGAAVLRRLLASADVFITNVRTRSLQKTGLDYESLAPEFPRLVYAHLTAFGRVGPKVNDPGYDYGAWWAHTGIMDLVRSSDEGDMPRFPGGIGDNSTAVQLAGYIGLALFHRERTGKGQLVDASLFRSGIAAIAQPLIMFAGGNSWARSVGPTHIRATTKPGERATMITNAFFRCKDGTYVQLLGEDVRRHLRNTLAALDLTYTDLFGSERPDWSKVDWTAATRMAERVVASRSYQEWFPIFERHNVWFARIQRFENMFSDEQAVASGIFAQDVPGVRHPLIRSPVQLSADQAQPRGSAPAFGEHTLEVLREAGFSEGELQRLHEDGVVK